MASGQPEGFVLLTTSIFMILLFIYFIWFEYGVYRTLKGKMKLKFVILTLAANSAQICITAMNAFYFFNGMQVFTIINSPTSADVLLNIVSASADVFLLILRIRGLLMTSIFLSKLVKFLGICFAISCALTLLVTVAPIIVHLSSSTTKMFSTLFGLATVSLGCVMISLDIVSTFAFARLAFERRSKSKLYISQSEQTQVIALIGVVICGLTFLNLLLFSCSHFILTYQNVFWTAFLMSENSIAILWILMKLKIDSEKKSSLDVENKGGLNQRMVELQGSGVNSQDGRGNIKESLLSNQTSSGESTLSGHLLGHTDRPIRLNPQFSN
jgi:hypothetical protein